MLWPVLVRVAEEKDTKETDVAQSKSQLQKVLESTSIVYDKSKGNWLTNISLAP